MGNLSAIFYAGESLAQYLSQSYPDALRQQAACEFRFFGTGQLTAKPPTTTTLVLTIYNTLINEHSRNAIRRTGASAGTVPLGLDLYLLMSVWTEDAFEEYTIFGWAMRQLYMTPLLDSSVLSSLGGWQAEDALQISPIDLRVEELTRIWEGLRHPFRLSVAYLARVLNIDVPPETDHKPVVATRFTYAAPPTPETTP
jgi:hypothetical protein